MLATLGSFCVAPLWSLRRLKINLTKEEELAYIALWRHIGCVTHARRLSSHVDGRYYLGIDPILLERHFSTVSGAEKGFASTAFHLFSDLTPVPSHEQSGSYRILLSIVDRPPTRPSPSTLVYLSRCVTGNPLADYLGLPSAIPLSVKLSVQASLLSQRFLIAFGKYYPRTGWDIERQLLLRTIMLAMVAWQLGSRRTRFVNKEEHQYGEKLEVDHESLPAEIVLGAEVGRQIKRRWLANIAEAVAVVGSLCVLTAWASWRLVQSV
jgi:hypothetical protein